MKAVLHLDQDADLTTITPEYQAKLAFRKERGKMVAYFPKGCEFEGEHAIALVGTGQASPSDDECAVACGMTPEQIKAKRINYAADAAGVRGTKDREMFLAGAILGYAEGTTDEKPIYIKGPNWDAWQAAEQAEKAKAEKDVI